MNNIIKYLNYLIFKILLLLYNIYKLKKYHKIIFNLGNIWYMIHSFIVIYMILYFNFEYLCGIFGVINKNINIKNLYNFITSPKSVIIAIMIYVFDFITKKSLLIITRQKISVFGGMSMGICEKKLQELFDNKLFSYYEIHENVTYIKTFYFRNFIGSSEILLNIKPENNKDYFSSIDYNQLSIVSRIKIIYKVYFHIHEYPNNIIINDIDDINYIFWRTKLDNEKYNFSV